MSTMPSAVTSRRESEELFRQLAAHIPEAVCVRDVGGTTVRYVNPAWTTLTKRALAAGDESGKMLAAIHPEDRRELLHKTDEWPGGGVDHECRVLQPDGAVRWVRAQTFGIRDATGAVYRVAWLMHDITEQKDLSARVLDPIHPIHHDFRHGLRG